MGQQQNADEEHLELYECPECGELSAVRVGAPCPIHECSTTSDEEASNDADKECRACGQLLDWCVCTAAGWETTCLEYAQPCDSDGSEANFNQDDFNVPLFNIYDDVPSPRASRVSCYDSD